MISYIKMSFLPGTEIIHANNTLPELGTDGQKQAWVHVVAEYQCSFRSLGRTFVTPSAKLVDILQKEGDNGFGCSVQFVFHRINGKGMWHVLKLASILNMP